MARREADLIGEREVPEDVLWGIHTARARDNFPLSGRPAMRRHDPLRCHRASVGRWSSPNQAKPHIVAGFGAPVNPPVYLQIGRQCGA